MLYQLESNTMNDTGCIISAENEEDAQRNTWAWMLERIAHKILYEQVEIGYKNSILLTASSYIVDGVDVFDIEFANGLVEKFSYSLHKMQTSVMDYMDL